MHSNASLNAVSPVVTFIGGGNMATAIIEGLLCKGSPPGRLRIAEPSSRRRKYLAERLENHKGLSIIESNTLQVNEAQVVILAVKPAIVPIVLSEVAQVLDPTTVVLSIAAGVTLDQLSAPLDPHQPVIRAMPNTPALVGEGITALCPGKSVSQEHLAMAETILEAVGQVITVQDENLIDGVTALSGSGPAYVFLMAEALSDGGVACGLPRDQADRLAVQTLLGASVLMNSQGTHPGVLKNQVTSPGGTTIAGIAHLEKSGVRGALIGAVEAAWKRSREMGGKG